jgi:uncharacterized protein YerC
MYANDVAQVRRKYSVKALPVWYDNCMVMYHIPNELKNLTITEKLLIQRVSLLIIGIHIKNGTLGCRGHIVSFFQDICTICSTLPCLPTDISIVKVIRDGTTKDGDNITPTFSVNLIRVIKALHWLKKHNQLYRDIIITESNLDWMNGKG